VASRSSLLGALLALACALQGLLAVAAQPALAESVGEKIVEKCAHGEPFGGYTAADYREALKDMSTAAREYLACESEIRKAELAAAGSGTGTASQAGGASAHVALPLTPTEQKAVQSAHKHGSAPVQVGAQPIRPGVVHANIASAVNRLPTSLLVVLALLLAAVVALAAGEVRKRVRARHRG